MIIQENHAAGKAYIYYSILVADYHIEEVEDGIGAVRHQIREGSTKDIDQEVDNNNTVSLEHHHVISDCVWGDGIEDARAV